MADVVREILLCLLLAAALGVATGWFARGLRARRAAASEAEDFQRTLGAARAQLLALETARNEVQPRLAGLQKAADSAQAQAEALRQQLQEAHRAREAERRDTSLVRAEVVKLSSHVKDAEARLKEAQSSREALSKEVEQLQAARPSGATGEATRQRLDTLRATLQAAEAGWDSARAQAEAAVQELTSTRRQVAESEADRQVLATRLADAQALLIDLRSKIDVTPEVATLPVAEETRLPLSRAPPPSGPKPVEDDLRRIRGVGPVLERSLHRLGVYRYAQIASWTPEDIQAISQRLPGFHSRIVRDRWTKAARRLHIAKYGNPP